MSREKIAATNAGQRRGDTVLVALWADIVESCCPKA